MRVLLLLAKVDLMLLVNFCAEVHWLLLLLLLLVVVILFVVVLLVAVVYVCKIKIERERKIIYRSCYCNHSYFLFVYILILKIHCLISQLSLQTVVTSKIPKMLTVNLRRRVRL